MKTWLTIFALAVVGAKPCSAQWAVLDLANLQQSAANYAAMGEQLANQASEIANQVRQIQQFESQLKRMGDMANVKSLVGFSEFRADLSLPTKLKSWASELPSADGRGLFGDARGGLFREISPDFRDVDGSTVARDVSLYRDAHAMTLSVDEFKSVQGDVLSRRDVLKRTIAQTSEALQSADTEAEEKKLAALLNAQYSELAAVDAEVTLSAAQVQVKASESVAMRNAQSEADAETRRRLSQQEAQKLSTVFQPQYECLLQYVTEQRLSRN